MHKLKLPSFKARLKDLIYWKKEQLDKELNEFTQEIIQPPMLPKKARGPYHAGKVQYGSSPSDVHVEKCSSKMPDRG